MNWTAQQGRTAPAGAELAPTIAPVPRGFPGEAGLLGQPLMAGSPAAITPYSASHIPSPFPTALPCLVHGVARKGGSDQYRERERAADTPRSGLGARLPRRQLVYVLPSPLPALSAATIGTCVFAVEPPLSGRAAGLPWSCLDFRHKFGSHLARRGVSLYKISRFMGNSPQICRRDYAVLIPATMTDDVSNVVELVVFLITQPKRSRMRICQWRQTNTPTTT